MNIVSLAAEAVLFLKHKECMHLYYCFCDGFLN